MKLSEYYNFLVSLGESIIFGPIDEAISENIHHLTYGKMSVDLPEKFQKRRVPPLWNHNLAIVQNRYNKRSNKIGGPNFISEIKRKNPIRGKLFERILSKPSELTSATNVNLNLPKHIRNAILRGGSRI